VSFIFNSDVEIFEDKGNCNRQLLRFRSFM